MQQALKIRLIGAAVLVAVAVIVVPLFFPATPDDAGNQNINLYIPPVPDQELKTRTVSVVPSSQGGSDAANTSNNDTLARVDIPSRVPNEVMPGGVVAGASSNGTTPTQDTAPAVPSESTPAAAGKTTAKTPPTSSSEPDESPGKAAQVRYIVRLGAYAAKDNAQDLAAKVQKLGFPVRLTKVEINGKPAARVDAGPFDSRASAERARLKLSTAAPQAAAKLATVTTDQSGDTPAPKGQSAPKAAGWAVQVVAYSKQSDANALRDKLRKAGFDGYVDSVKSDGNTLWRVRVGPQAQRDDALALRDRIKHKFPKLSGIVVNVP